LKVTVPVAALGEVVAVKVTFVPATGVVLDAANTVVLAVSAVTDTTEEVLVA
jgi:hypothetical protein